MCQKMPGNLSNPPDWPLAAFTLYSHPLSADIKSAYRKVKVSPEHRNFQLLVLFNFEKDDWENYPILCQQLGLPFGCIQSGTFLELILIMVAKATTIFLAALVILYFRQVDNFLYSFRSKEMIYKVGFKIDRVMKDHNLHLQLPFSTTQQDHYDFELDHSSEVVLGYEWDKVLNQILPHTIISHKRGTQGKKGLLLSEQRFTPETMTKRVVLSVLSMLYNPLGVFYSILKITMKALFSQLSILVPGKTKQSFDQPITQQCPDLAHLCCQLCNQLTNLKYILPLKRYVVPDNYQVQYMIACKDGSSIGHSATLHLVSKDKGKLHS